jgi:hypothetical protein
MIQTYFPELKFNFDFLQNKHGIRFNKKKLRRIFKIEKGILLFEYFNG